MAFDLFLTLVLGTARLPVTMLASHVVFLFVGLGSVDFKTGMGRTWSPIMLAVKYPDAFHVFGHAFSPGQVLQKTGNHSLCL